MSLSPLRPRTGGEKVRRKDSAAEMEKETVAIETERVPGKAMIAVWWLMWLLWFGGG